MKTRVAVIIFLAICGSSLAAQPVDLYCEISGSSYFNDMKKTYPNAGTLVYRVDASRRSVTNIAGIFSNEPVWVSEWDEYHIALEQPDAGLSPIPGIVGLRIIRFDRTTARFTIAYQFRNQANVTLSQFELDTAYQKAGSPGLFPPMMGPALSGECATRKQLF